jgi:mannitol-1-phosphate/altronate dehydrogenase
MQATQNLVGNTQVVFGFDNLPAHVKASGYDRASVKRGICHIGIGGFASAHFLPIIQDTMVASSDYSYGFVVASLRSPGTITALRASDHRYMLIEREEQERNASVMTPILESIFAPENPLALVDVIADGDIKIVSVTITNKGYYVQDAHGTLDASHHDIVHDLDYEIEHHAGGDAPRTIHWYLKAGIEKRMAQSIESGIARPLTVLSLDNVPQNSQSLKTAFLQYVEASTEHSAALVDWINDNVDFLTTLVDRITPEVTKAFRTEAAEFLGFDAGVVIGTEKFTQLVVEKGRFQVPAWELVGVESVDNIGSYWELKFLGLNAAHQVPAMVGPRLGATYIHEACLIPEVGSLLELFHKELGVILGDDLMSAYGAKIQRRFKDSAPMDTILRVGARGTSKASERIAYAVERGLANTDGEKVLLAPTFVFACWLLNLGCTDELGNTFQQSDVEQPKLASVYQEVLAWTRSEERDHHALAHILRSIGEVVRDDRFVVMAGKAGFITELSWSLNELVSGDTKTAIRNLLARVSA